MAKSVSACFRFVTQSPWDRIPVDCKKLIFSIQLLVDLVGGRNKLLAKKAYDLYNPEIAPQNMSIKIPETP